MTMHQACFYYPSQSVFDNSWLRQALLYWDEINSLLRQNMKDVFFNDTMRMLQAEGLYTPLWYDDLHKQSAWTSELNQVANELIVLLDSSEFQRGLPPDHLKREL